MTRASIAYPPTHDRPRNAGSFEYDSRTNSAIREQALEALRRTFERECKLSRDLMQGAPSNASLAQSQARRYAIGQTLSRILFLSNRAGATENEIICAQLPLTTDTGCLRIPVSIEDIEDAKHVLANQRLLHDQDRLINIRLPRGGRLRTCLFKGEPCSPSPIARLLIECADTLIDLDRRIGWDVIKALPRGDDFTLFFDIEAILAKAGALFNISRLQKVIDDVFDTTRWVASGADDQSFQPPRTAENARAFVEDILTGEWRTGRILATSKGRNARPADHKAAAMAVNERLCYFGYDGIINHRSPDLTIKMSISLIDKDDLMVVFGDAQDLNDAAALINSQPLFHTTDGVYKTPLGTGGLYHTPAKKGDPRRASGLAQIIGMNPNALIAENGDRGEAGIAKIRESGRNVWRLDPRALIEGVGNTPSTDRYIGALYEALDDSREKLGNREISRQNIQGPVGGAGAPRRLKNETAQN